MLRVAACAVQFAGFAMLFLAFVMCVYFAYNAEFAKRSFRYVAMTICGIASLAYV